MTIAFRYRPRRALAPFHQALSGSLIELEERVEYVLAFQQELSSTETQRLLELGGEMIGSELAVLSFGNFVGRSEFAGVSIDVVSTKVGVDGVSRILEEVSTLASNLVFGWRAPTNFQVTPDRSRHAPVPYHQLQFLRRMMLGESTGQRLQDFLEMIERNPTRRFEPERPLVPPSRVRRLDQRAVHAIFHRLERLVRMPTEVALATSPLAQALTFGTPEGPHFPVQVAAPHGKLSLDTPENRFVKHVLSECLALVYCFIDHPRLHSTLRADCRSMLGILEQFATAPFLAEADQLTSFQAPSQALAKADGYREIFAFWVGLTSHVSLPRTAVEANRFLEGRDMATLYEYWVFTKILEAVVKITGLKPSGRPVLSRNEFGESLAIGFASDLSPDISLRFNASYHRSSGTAYSTPLRPDVTIKIGDDIHAFDAKYRLDRFEVNDSDVDDGLATYKRADLYKMHTYRDAIVNLKTAFVVYPGSEFVFFERRGNKKMSPYTITIMDGVGAIPLRPAVADPTVDLRVLLQVLLSR